MSMNFLLNYIIKCQILFNLIFSPFVNLYSNNSGNGENSLPFPPRNKHISLTYSIYDKLRSLFKPK